MRRCRLDFFVGNETKKKLKRAVGKRDMTIEAKASDSSPSSPDVMTNFSVVSLPSADGLCGKLESVCGMSLV